MQKEIPYFSSTFIPLFQPPASPPLEAEPMVEYPDLPMTFHDKAMAAGEWPTVKTMKGLSSPLFLNVFSIWFLVSWPPTVNYYPPLATCRCPLPILRPLATTPLPPLFSQRKRRKKKKNERGAALLSSVSLLSLSKMNHGSSYRVSSSYQVDPCWP